MPSFTIEAESETNPLSVQTIFQTLSQASVANQQSLKVATQQLTNWEKTPGYYSLLQDIYSDFTLDPALRLQAVIQLKNGIDKHWRKTSVHAITKDEKQKIKSKAIAVGVDEPKPHLALHNALMLSKIVRFEFPHDWPDVMSTIMQHLRAAGNSEAQSSQTSNILNITLQVIKELSAGRLQRTRRNLEAVAPELLGVLAQLYLELVQRWSSAGDKVTPGAVQNSYAALKTIRRLVVAGFEHPHRDATVAQLWHLLQEHHDSFWTLWTMSSRNNDDVHTALLVKHLFQLNKLYLDMARQHPASFVLLGSMDVLKRSWNLISGNDAKLLLSGGLDWDVHRDGDVDDETSPVEKLALKSLLLFRACVKMVFNPVHTFKYQHPEDKDDRKKSVEQIRTQVFTNEFVVRLMEILVTQYFVLRPSDLRDWEQEPDEWERREEEIADAWEFSVRSCSEKLFLDLVIHFKELLVPKLLQVFEQYASLDNQDVLLKDSLYSAIGIAAACLEDTLDFNTFLRTVLVPEVQLPRANYNLLRRRTAILLGQWVPMKPEILDRRATYQIFTFLMSRTDKLNDHVVRVTAGRQLRLVLDPFEFNYEDFSPYATTMLESLMSLIHETELSETKMALLETVRVAVSKLETHVEPYAQGIMSMLPTLWTESGEEHLMKQAILTMITTIINSLGRAGVAYHGPVLPLIRDSVAPGSEAVVYLLEDALDLWAAILQQTPTNGSASSPELLSLSQSLLPLLEMGSDHLRQCFELLESYTILSPSTLLKPETLSPLLSTMTGLLGLVASSRARDASLAPHVLENIITTIMAKEHFHLAEREQALRHLVSTMIDTGYLTELLRILQEAYQYHQDPRANLKPPDIVGVGETSLFTLLARVALSSPDVFVQALSATGTSLDWVLQEWLGHFDAVGDVLRKKLQILAVTNLLKSSSPPPQVLLENLQGLMTAWTDILTELAEGAADENQGDYLWSPTPESPSWPDEAPENARKRLVFNADPIYVINTRDFVAEALRSTIVACGGQAVFENEWLRRIDPVVLQSFNDLNL